jgi:hypothetical protein
VPIRMETVEEVVVVALEDMPKDATHRPRASRAQRSGE